jgi:CheY-like chemotaxis protein
MRALVADDDAETRTLVASAIARLGFEVVTVRSGGDLLEQLAEDPDFDVIVTDVAMNWMNGLQAIRAARNSGLRVPVVVITGLREPFVADELARLGSSVLLFKPFSPDELQAALRSVMALT